VDAEGLLAVDLDMRKRRMEERSRKASMRYREDVAVMRTVARRCQC
jgi:hypothetical protein